MNLPNQFSPVMRDRPEGAYSEPVGGVMPSQRVCTPCIRLPSGRFCVNLPIVGRKCFNVPQLGSWRACCQIRFGWPPVSCGISRC